MQGPAVKEEPEFEAYPQPVPEETNCEICGSYFCMCCFCVLIGFVIILLVLTLVGAEKIAGLFIQSHS